MKSTTTDRVQKIAFMVLTALSILLLSGCPQNLFFGIESAVRDDEGPEITFINPSDGQAVSGTLVVTGIATDKYRVTRVSIQVNGQAPVELKGTNNWYHTLDTSLLEEGPHTITVIARDEWGNVSQKSVSIVVDQSVPEVIIPPDFEPYFSGTDVTLSGTAEDDNEVARVQISFDGGVTYQDTELEPSGSKWTWSYTIADTAAIIPGDGSTFMLLRVYDDAGLIGSNGLEVYFDNTPPQVSIGTPADNVTIDSSEDLQNDMLVVSGTASDYSEDMPAGVAKVEIRLRDGTHGPILHSQTVRDDNHKDIKNYSESFDLRTVGPTDKPDIRNYGPVDIEVVAFDRAGNSATAIVSISLDDDPPAFDPIITVDGAGDLDGDLGKPINNFPAGEFIIAGTVSVAGVHDELPADIEKVEIKAGTSVDPASVFDYELVDNPDLGLEDGAVDGVGNWAYTLDAARFDQDGTYYLTFRVTNTRGGFDRVSRRIRFDRVDPTVLISSPSDGASVSGTNVSISGQVSGTGSPMQFINLVITDDVGGTQAELVHTQFSYQDSFTAPVPAGSDPYGPYPDLAYENGVFAWSWDTSEFSDAADIRIAITATDMAGNTYTREIVVTQDPTAPAGIFTEYDHPTNTAFQNRPLFPGRFINGEGVIRGLATGSLGIKSVELSTDNATWAPATISALAAPEWEWEFDLPNLPDGGLPEGQHILYLKVTDAVEATNTISIVVEVDNTDPEVTGPVVSLLDGSGTDYFHGTVSVTGTAGDGESEVASVVVTVDDQPLPVSGSAFYEADWDTQSLPTSGGQPVIAKDEIVVRTVVTDAAGNTAEDRLEVDVRPFITSVSRPSAYLGETGITISGNNLGRAGAPPAVTVNGGPVAAIAAASSNSVSFTLPATFPPVGGLSSGPVVVTFNGVSNAEQDPVKMDLFHLTTVADDRSPVYPDAVWHDNGSAGKLIYAYAGQQQNDRYVYFHDGMTRRQLETAGGARFAYTRVAAHDGSDLVFVTRSRDGLVIRSTTDDFAGVDPIVTETLSATATYHDIAVDSAGVAHIAYYDGGELRHRQWGGAADPPPTAGIVVDGAGSDAGMWVAITVDSSDRPHVVYHDATMNSLRYSYRTEAGTWAAPRTVDADAAGTFGNGIAIDATGGIHVSYYNGDSGNLMYAEATGPTAAFDTQIVDSQGITGWFSSIALDADNSPHITYASFSALKPKYARLSNGSFVTATIAESALYDINNNSNSTATVIDGASRVNMIYTTTDGKLRRAVYLPETLPEE